MDPVTNSIVDFIRARQLNIAIAGLLTIIYLVYQYWGVMFKERGIEEDIVCHHRARLSRSRSRSVSRSASRSRTRGGHSDYDDKHGRRRKKRCPDCSLCNFLK